MDSDYCWWLLCDERRSMFHPSFREKFPYTDLIFQRSPFSVSFQVPYLADWPISNQWPIEWGTPNHNWLVALESDDIFIMKSLDGKIKQWIIFDLLWNRLLKYLFNGIWKNSLTMQMKKALTLQLHAGKYFFKLNLILFEIDNVYCWK